MGEKGVSSEKKLLDLFLLLRSPMVKLLRCAPLFSPLQTSQSETPMQTVKSTGANCQNH